MKIKATLIVFILFLISTKSYSYLPDKEIFNLTPRLSFYSYEKNGELLLQTPEIVSGRVFSVKLTSSDGMSLAWKGKAVNGIARIPVSFDKISVTTRIDAMISPASENLSELNRQYTASCTLVRLEPKTNEVKTDRLTGGIIVNRRQFFPFGFYCYSPVNPALPEEEAVKGFNMISPYQKITPESLPERRAYMDRCAQLGMKVHYNLLSVSGGGGVGSKIEGLSDARKRELLIAEIKTFMDHPALLAWYIADEPTGNNVSPEALEEIYNVVKTMDPWHPVSIVFMAPFLSSRKFSNAVDIVMADPYPVPDLNISMVGDVAGKLSREFQKEKPVWMVPQAFGGGELWEREPSLQEIRSMTYQSIIYGATGIQYFVRQGPNAFPKSVPAWNECGRMAVEIAELTPWLLSDEPANIAESFSRNIVATSRLHNGQLLILTANKANEPVTTTIRINGLSTTKAKVVFENRIVTVTNGILTDPLPAFGTQAYLIDIKIPEENNRKWSGNQVKDPGFEDITSAGVPSNCYVKPGNDKGATYFTDTREHLDGNHSIRIITPKDSCGVSLKFFPVIVEAGKSYIVSLWSKREDVQKFSGINNPIRPGTKIISDNGQIVEISLGDFGKATFIPGADWKQYITTFAIPDDTTKRFKTNILLNMPGKGVAWFDMLQMIEDPLK
jgi:hypothetical protein